MVAYKTRDENDDVIFTLSPAADGWARKTQRYPGYGYGYGNRLLHFDNWDRTELHYTKTRVKAMFKSNYFHRKFDPSKPAGAGGLGIEKMGKIRKLKNQKNMFSNSAAIRHIPWWKRKMLRGNPFNANGEMCKKE